MIKEYLEVDKILEQENEFTDHHRKIRVEKFKILINFYNYYLLIVVFKFIKIC